MSDPIQLLATCAFGLEAIVKRELSALDIESRVVSPGKLAFTGDERTIARTNLWLRTADRVLIELASFEAADFDTLFETVKGLPWARWIPRDGQFPVKGRSLQSQLSSVPACQRAVKRAVVESLKTGHSTQELPEDEGRYQIEIALLKNQASLTLDTTGASLHKRGYRVIGAPAPLKETLASAMVQLSFWRPERPLLDPFCGSGTIPIEAALLGRNIAPGLNRDFAAETWPTLQAKLWDEEREQARSAIKPAMEERLLGTDVDERVLRAARSNADSAGVASDVHFQPRDFLDTTSKRKYGCVITNPPYGERIGDPREMDQLYHSFPLVLRKLPTWSHFVLTGYSSFEQIVGKRADRRRKLYNGRIECTYFQFHGPNPNASHRESNPAPAEANANDDEHKSLKNESPHPDATQPAAPQPESPWSEASQPKSRRAESQRESPQRESPQPSAPQPAAPQPESPWSEAPQPETTRAESQPESPQRESPQSESPWPGRSDAQEVRRSSPWNRQPAVFGGLTAKAKEQAELFKSRLTKRARHLRRWPTRRKITCFRVYERDIPEIPLVVDRYEDHLHIVEFERPHDRDAAQHADWLDLMVKVAGETLEIPAQNVFLKSRFRQRGKAQHERLSHEEHEVVVHEGGLEFLVNLSDYIDTGLFLDHRATRSMVRDAAEGTRFLNLFAYTGSFSVYAAAGGAAETTTVDWSNTYLEWAKRNMGQNQFKGPQHQFVRMDVPQFVRDLPDAEQFDLAVVDPPTFSNSKRTENIWDIQHHHAELLCELSRRMVPAGMVYFSTNSRRFKLDESALAAYDLREISRQTVPEDYRNQRIHRCWRLTKKS